MSRLLSMLLIEQEKERAEGADERFKTDLLIADPERYFNIYEKKQDSVFDVPYEDDYSIPQSDDDLRRIRREMWRDGLLSPEDIALIESEHP